MMDERTRTATSPDLTGGRGPATWSGEWVARRLDVALRTTRALPGLDLHDLVGLAVRRNPRRAHLLVSNILGKHVPVDPLVVRGSGLVLGELVRRALVAADASGADAGENGSSDRAADDSVGDAVDASLARVGHALHRALQTPDSPDGAANVAEFASAVASLVDPRNAPACVVMGFAETATALGQCVADALRAPSIHSTRRAVAGFEPVGAFEEEHSHATSHLVLPSDDAFFARRSDGRLVPLVLVDDELSTGRTVLNTIAALHESLPRDRYVVATLVDMRSDDDRAVMQARARELGTRIDVVALAAGHLDLPDDVLERGQQLVAKVVSEPARPGSHAAAGGEPRADPRSSQTAAAPIVELDIPWPLRTPLTARHGVSPAQLAPLAATLPEAAAAILRTLPPGDGDVLVLGTEELMDAPLRLACALRDAGQDTRFSTTTRSPVLAVGDPGYAIRTALTFPAFDDPADGPGPRFTYNVSRETPWRAIVLCVDPPGPTPQLHAPGGVLDTLARHAGAVIVARLPDMTTAPARGLVGRTFGSYAADEVTWLLKDLADVTLEAPTEEREEAIQSGGAHYAESLPVEYQPDEAYGDLFRGALEESRTRVAAAVAAVTELALAERGDDVVLVSLARAGTPVGILMKRWARRAHGLDVPHYAVSIVRGRGIDTVALDHVAARHDPKTVLFVDGWTGKGAISRELVDALAQYEQSTGVRFDPALAVLADTGSCTTMWGTRDDFLIPSACLNSTVSGLVSRTVLNDDLIGPGEFHGAKFYAELAPHDVSNLFLDAVTEAFPEPAEAEDIRADARARCAAEPPRWTGWATVEKLADEFGIGSVNLVKPGVGETTRVLLRRVPWKILVAPGAGADLRHIEALAAARGVPTEEYPGLDYSCVGLIHPRFTRGATGDDGTAARAATDLTGAGERA
ncbi:phosphoribosyltransferase [Dermacoccus nishinomiyaensis]|uniref:phosphoribosyltransferase n=1 Tax=Dermacoccus nishinomiyaensis TaxID=1274 RepID=UPI0021A4EA01|nr:phosphoribosyltransferase [Dermacoccus nishinomiyaensis]MCT1604109.1 phosphoribosyltransferase [Dermacoccus nishinomiyaensis]